MTPRPLSDRGHARRLRGHALAGVLGLPLAGALLGALATTGAVHAADTAYVSSADLGTIVEVDLRSGRVTPFAEAGRPEGGACSPGRVVFFADAFAERIFRFAPDGTRSDAVPALGALVGPEGPSFDDAGNLYFVTHPERSWLPDGAFKLAGGDATRTPEPIAPRFSSWAEGTSVVRGGPHKGALLLVGATESRVWLREPATAPGTLRLLVDASAFPDIAGLYGIVTDESGLLYVSSTTGIYRFDAEGRFVDVYVEAPAGSSFGFIDIGSRGELYVVDSAQGILWRVGADRALYPVAAVKSPLGVAVCRDALVGRPAGHPVTGASDGARAR